MSPDQPKKLDEKAIIFWYRQSPGSFGASGFEPGSLGPGNPPLEYSGENGVWLDTKGNLVGMLGVPSQEERKPVSELQPNWELLFSEGGLDIDD